MLLSVTLTGKSTPVENDVAPTAPEAVVADRTFMLHKGTAITRGTGAGVVVATGMAELGLTTRLVIEAQQDRSPIERKLLARRGETVKQGAPALLQQ